MDVWKPEANLYESGKTACAGSHSVPQKSHFANKSSVLTVSTIQIESIQEKDWVSAQPVIEGSLGESQMAWLLEVQCLSQQILSNIWDH